MRPSYHCEELDISKCNILGSCTFFEHCEHWCVDLTAPGGAVCADGPPEHIETRGEVAAQAVCEDTNSSSCT